MTHKNSTAGTGRLSRREWGVLLVLCGALFLDALDALDASMIGMALPSIRRDQVRAVAEDVVPALGAPAQQPKPRRYA
jgi:hypothetical protein